jgi:trehalose 6-phosphate synthase
MDRSASRYRRRFAALVRLIRSTSAGSIALYGVIGMAALAITVTAIFALSPFASSLVKQWSRSDVEGRSRVIASSMRDSVTGLLGGGETSRLSELFDRVALDERVVGIAFCGDRGQLRAASRNLPTSLSCERFIRSGGENFSTIRDRGRKVLVGTFPVTVGDTNGHLAILHDLAFADTRAGEARTYLLALLAIAILGSTALAGIASAIVLRRWLNGLRRTVESASAGEASNGAGGEHDGPLADAVRQMLRELDLSRVPADLQQTDWTAETLRNTITSELPGTEVLVVSNREPYIHNHTAEGPEVQIPASGLVSALEPIMRACGGTWIAHGSGSADRDVVDANDRLQVPPEQPSYTLRRVWLTDEEQDGYYYGFANEGMWPLCHIAFVRPRFRESDWHAYRLANQRFADAVVREARTKNPIVLVQDYHFALLPRMVRERLPEATIITFWHIPWPNSETFGICPWKEEIIDGLLGSSILGFHTRFHCNNFLETVDRFAESRIDREQVSVLREGRETLVRSYPISIEWPPAALIGQKPVDECRRAVFERLGLPEDTKLAVGIERFDYTKGIPDRIRAVDAFLTAHPRWKGRFVFVQVAAPTRSRLPSYQFLQDEAVALAQEINERHGTATWRPIHLLARHHSPREVFELFRAADMCIVSALHDGMNLVAKEFVAARDDEQGVLILSRFAGASRELSEALLVNPFDAHSMGLAIERALAMPQTEQRERMKMMREQVRSRNVYRWAGQMVLDASRLRKKQGILSLVDRRRRPVLVPLPVSSGGGRR